MPLPNPDTLLSLFSLEAILALPWYVGIPGLMVVAIFVWSAFRALLLLRIFKVIANLVMAAVVFIILSQGGNALVQMIGAPPPAAT
ncbi:MAG: hypothetical protein AAF362_16425 [Pseudomonadota bacterium]